jgi:hypothetical protein
VEVPAPRGAYYDIAWLASDTLAVTRHAPDNEVIELLRVQDGTLIDQLTLPARTDCPIRLLAGLSRTPDGVLAYGDTCQDEGGFPTQRALLQTYDVSSDTVTGLGAIATTPLTMSWSADGSELTYTAGSALCETTFRRTAISDGPLDISVIAQGREFSIGENVLAPDRCTQLGNSRNATLADDGNTIAVLASAGGGDEYGPDRLDLPWAVVVIDDQKPATIVDGIQHPGGLVWISSDRLVFSGFLNDNRGTWSVNRDGSELRLLTREALGSVAVSQDRQQLIGLIQQTWPPGEISELDVRVYRFELE